MIRSSQPRSLTALAVTAGLLYSSWPLGYILNPEANRGLASNLEASGQPYNWLFIALDIISGLLICYIAWRLYRRLQRGWLLKAAVMGFGSFGLLTAIDAMLPIDCVARVGIVCRPALEDPNFIIHGIASIGSVQGLSVSIAALWWLVDRQYRLDTDRWLRVLLTGTLLVWLAFGLGTGALIWFDLSSAGAQHVFITVCTLWTAGMPWLVDIAATEAKVAHGRRQHQRA